MQKKDQTARALTDDERVELTKFAHALDLMREVYPDLTLNSAATFVRFAVKPGSGQAEASNEMNLPKTTVSRIVQLLGDKGTRAAPGLGLLSKTFGDDERSRAVQPTPKGVELARKIIKALS